jgi:hypothetical protein
MVVDAEEDLAYVGRSVPWQLRIPPPGPTCPPEGPTCTPTLSATRPPDEAWLHVVSLATPAAPAGEGAWSSYGADMRVSALAVDPDRGLALVGMLSATNYRRARLVALDVSGSGPPDYLAAIDMRAQDMAMSGGLLFVAAGDQGLRIIRTLAPVPMLFMPSAMRNADLVSTAGPTATPTTANTSTATRTPLPSYFGIDGYVLEGSTSGRGVPNVEIALWIDGAAQMPVLTDADGFYSTPILELQAADWVAVPRKAGFTFEPPSVSGRHEGWPREHVERASFVAFRGTPTPSATAAQETPTPGLVLWGYGREDGVTEPGIPDAAILRAFGERRQRDLEARHGGDRTRIAGHWRRDSAVKPRPHVATGFAGPPRAARSF